MTRSQNDPKKQAGRRQAKQNTPPPRQSRSVRLYNAQSSLARSLPSGSVLQAWYMYKVTS